ncbi:MAG: PKD domain-containing protein, partial [Thermoanaerobaculia bacterium]
MRIGLIATLSMCLALLSAPPVPAGVCGDLTPGRPVPECRHQNGGLEVDCTDPNAVRLWPGGLRPGLPGQVLPQSRDSTQYNSTTIPGALSGHELFHSLDIVGSHLYATYNAGVQVWQISGIHAENPNFLIAKDGWRGDFFEFQAVGENDFYIDDDAAIATGGRRLVAVSGRSTVGFSLWEHTVSPFDFDQLYQDINNRSQEVVVVNYGDRDYAFAAGTLGVFVYDMTFAQDMSFPCIDQGGAICPGVYKGKLGTTNIALHLDLIERGGRIYVVKSGGNGLPVEIWETSNPANPGIAVRRFQGLSAGGQGVAFFELGGVAYLGVVEKSGTSWRIRIYDVDGCLDTNGCGSLGPALYTKNVVAAASTGQFLTYSTSGATPFLYYGLNEINLEGGNAELLLDLTGFPGLVSEYTDSGGTYFDACSSNQVDYWGDYHPKNGFGMGNVRPMVGKFSGNYFYRAAYGMLDVHVKTIESATLLITGGPPGGVGFVDVGYTFDAAALACVPDPVWDWSASGGGQVTGTGDTVQISWPTAGSKIVTASNSGCAAPPATLDVEIQDAAAAVGSVGVDPAAPSVCETVTFTAVDVTGQPPFTADWIIRDGSGMPVATAPDAGLSFEWATDDTTPTGNYNAEVVVSNAANMAGDPADTDFVLAAATLEFTQQPTYDGAPGPGLIDVPVQFRVVTAGASSWTWDFGDGSDPAVFTSRAAGENPQHTYTIGSTYDVTVTIENCVGAMDTAQVSVEIIEEELQVKIFRANCPQGVCQLCPGTEV